MSKQKRNIKINAFISVVNCIVLYFRMVLKDKLRGENFNDRQIVGVCC